MEENGKKQKQKRAVSRKVKVILITLLAIPVLAGVALTFYLNPYFFRRPVEEIVRTNQEPCGTDFDVIVVGAEPEGIAAAVSAARNGMKTLLLEESNTLGGLMTLGQLNFIDMCHGRDGTLLTEGFFEEFYEAVGGTAFDIAEAKNFFISIVDREPLLTLRTESALLSPLMDGAIVTGVRMLEQGKDIIYTGKRIIDATTDGDITAMAGAPYTYGGEDIRDRDRNMGVTLVFELSGVNWPKVFFHLNTERLRGLITGNAVVAGASNKAAWGYDSEGLAYVSNDRMTRLRGLNIARQRTGSVLINALVVYDVNPLDRNSYLNAMERAKMELEYLLPYICDNYSGFEKAQLASTASRLYVRETRHFIGEYQLTIDDVLENRDQWDKIAIGSYPVDVQPSIQQPYGTVIGNPDRYAVPFRCLIPMNADNLLIVGRSASFMSLAAASARVLPLGMVCGQAAGVAASISIRNNLNFRQMSRNRETIDALQSTLREQGAYLDNFTINDPIVFHWAYEGLATLRRLGLVCGGYNNDYQIEEPIDRDLFQYLINSIGIKAGYSLNYYEIDGLPVCGRILDASAFVFIGAEKLNKHEFLSAANREIQKSDVFEMGSSGRSHSDNINILSGAGVLDEALATYYLDSNKIPDTAEVMMLLANLYNCISKAER